MGNQSSHTKSENFYGEPKVEPDYFKTHLMAQIFDDIASGNEGDTLEMQSSQAFDLSLPHLFKRSSLDEQQALFQSTSTMSDSLSSERLGGSPMSQEEILMRSWKEGDILEIYDHIETPAAVYFYEETDGEKMMKLLE